MLDATASAAALGVLPPDNVVPTIELKTSFYRPVPVARLRATGKVLHQGRTTVFLEAFLYDADDILLAGMTATARIVTL